MRGIEGVLRGWGVSGNMGKMSPLNIGDIGKDEQAAPDPNEAVQNFYGNFDKYSRV